MKEYVLGFAFNDERDEVLLIEKARPEWQRGRCNGLGGKVELYETPLNAMVREFREECGIDTKPESWKYMGLMQGPDWDCHCFRIYNVDISKANTLTDEAVIIAKVEKVLCGKIKTISNIPWLVALALDQGAPRWINLRY